MDNTKRTFDWESIEAEYRCGLKSTREIAAAHGCSEAAIRKKAKKEEWSRDLSAKVRAKHEDMLRTQEVRSKVRTETPTEKQKIEISAEIKTDAAFGLRNHTDKFTKIVGGLFVEIETSAFESIEKKIDAVRKLGDICKIQTELVRKNYGLDSQTELDGSKQIDVSVNFV